MSITININGNPFNVEPNISVLQACEMANIVIPRFCYHERLSVAGNCRMCLVEVEKMPKLQVSCSIPVMPNMVVKTDSPAVKKAREGVLEFLLINHPLDCPICDQGGECDLQDQSLIYGGDRSRFKEFKRATEDKDCGPLIKTVMTRCIHCTRCVRFANEVIGVPAFGTSGRGNSLEIGTYVGKMLSSELSGNIIDLCPVGALTSKPYAFLARPWELKSTESIDIFDSLHSNIRIDTRGYDIMRILPRLNEAINEEWISDKARFSFDGLLVQRLTTPLVKDKEGLFNPISWDNALDLIVTKLKKTSSQNLTFLPGDLCDVETLLVVKNFTLLANAKVINQSFENYINSDYQTFFKFNTLIKNIAKADLCLLIGINPKIEGPILNYHLRKRFLLGNFNVSYIGSQLKLSFPTTQLGNSFSSLFSILEGSHSFCKTIKRSKRPLIIFGRSFQSYMKDNNLDLAFTILNKNSSLINNFWNGVNYFNNYTSNFAYYNFCLNTNQNVGNAKAGILYILENTKPLSKSINYDFLVYQGHHGCVNAQKADLILPSTSVMEKSSLYINCEGRLQYSQSASVSLNLAKPSAVILQTIFSSVVKLKEFTNVNLNINDFIPFSNFAINAVSTSFFSLSNPLYSCLVIQNSYICSSLFDNFYQTDIISENSTNMSKSSKLLLDKNPFSL